MNNMLSSDFIEPIKRRIQETEDLIKQVNDKHTYAYIKVLVGLKNDYELIGDSENADNVAKKCIYLILDKDTILDKKEQNKMLISCYDTRARCGDFESFLIAMEWKRPIEKQFYLPRRNILKKFNLVQSLQDVADGLLDFLFINMPPRTGKSTMGLFFIVFMAALSPDLSILGSGHSTSLTQSFYNEILNFCTSSEYRFNAIFPSITLANKSAEYSYLDFNNAKRFHTVSFRSIDAGTTGLVEASNLLYCDDLVKDVETANNIDRLDKLFHDYTGTIQDRKVQKKCKDGTYRPCPEIHINTPWSLYDPTSRLIKIYGENGKNPRVRVVSVPCYDEDGDSNFKYDYGKGFTKEYYQQLESSEDPVIFSAKYKMEPIERDGRPFTEDQLSFYSILPDEDPDTIVAYNDVAHGGDDYMSMPIGYVYGNEIYIHDVLFVNHLGDDLTRPRVCDKLIANKVERVGFEENNGGKPYADLISEDLLRRGYKTAVTTHKAPTNKSKLSRILGCQNEIKGNATAFGTYRIYFKTLNARRNNKEYNDFMRNLMNWSQKEGMTQKKQHDDAPDSLAGLITNVLNGNSKGVAKTIDMSR